MVDPFSVIFVLYMEEEDFLVGFRSSELLPVAECRRSVVGGIWIVYPEQKIAKGVLR